MTNHQWCMIHDKLYKEAWREWQRSITSSPISQTWKSVKKAREILKGTGKYFVI